MRQRLSRTWRDVASEDEPIGKAIGKKARVVVDSSDEEGAHLPKKARVVDNSDEEAKVPTWRARASSKRAREAAEGRGGGKPAGRCSRQ